jgi:hypothetical protein
MKKLIFIGAISVCIALGSCKGNGSTNGSNKVDSTKGLNDGTGAPGSGTGSEGAGTVGDSTKTPQDTTNGAPLPKTPQ